MKNYQVTFKIKRTDVVRKKTIKMSKSNSTVARNLIADSLGLSKQIIEIQKIVEL